MHKPIVIGVAGGTGAGKTTVTDQIYKSVSPDKIVFLHHDSYYKDQSRKPLEERIKTNYDHPDSLETHLMIKHLKSLLAGKAVDIPIYDFAIHNRTKKKEHITPKPLILVEGILIFVDKDLRELMDIKIFVDTDEDVRFIRRLKRDIAERGRTMESVIEQYLSTVKPMHLQFVEPSKRYADIVIPEGGYNKVALKMITSRVRDLLTEISS
ncbi:uridine kinase [Candidatus Microgenomates bacterium]|nr:uridine kinase [Candidatus Microgenomates bacterium]